MEYSDLSGDPLESDAATTVTCQFEDGVRRALTFTAAELADLKAKGTYLTPRHGPIVNRSCRSRTPS